MRSSDLINSDGRLLVVCPVRWIIGGFDHGKPLHAGGMNFCDAVLEGIALDILLDLAILEGSFQGNELTLLEGTGELREIALGVNARPLGAGLVLPLVVLPALLGGDVEGDHLRLF